MDEAINSIINSDADIYGILLIPPDATTQEIRRSYRQKALVYHPDKQGGDEHKFNLLLKSYEILSNPELRTQYDNLIAAKHSREVNRAKLDELTRRFQDELKANEDKVAQLRSKRKWENDVDKLREEGLRRRREREKQLLLQNVEDNNVVSIYDLPFDYVITDFKSVNTSVKLKYKYKPELENLMNEHVIKKIMQIFGPIRGIILKGHDDRYATAIVEYQNYKDAKDAALHNYKESARRWDGTDVRKLASLLRSCELLYGESHDSTKHPQVTAILKEYLKNVKSVSDNSQ